MHNRCAIFFSERTSNLIRLLVRSVRSKNSTTVVHYIINEFATALSDQTISLRAFALCTTHLEAPVIGFLPTLHLGQRPEPYHRLLVQPLGQAQSLSDQTQPPGFDPAAMW